jgi:murein DD-endopeptidase MepM/ murein hydrolase activator NlpD
MSWYLLQTRHNARRWRRAIGPALAAALAVLLVAAQPAHAQDGNGTPPPTPIPVVTIHVVQAGETVQSIAGAYHIPADVLMQANSLGPMDDISTGERLVIPDAVPTTADDDGQTLVTGLADTLTALAARYDVTPEEIAQLNGIANPTLMVVGQILRVPPAPAGDTADLVRLPSGSSPWHVALQRNVNVFALAAANGVDDPLLVLPGSLLRVPGSSGDTTELQPPWKSIDLHPLPLQQGRTGGLLVDTDNPGDVTVTFLGRTWDVFSDGMHHEALIGVDRWTKPGLYPMTLTYTGSDGSTTSYERNVLVASGEYTREQVAVSEEEGALLSDPATVQGELQYLTQKMTGFTPDKLWDGLFRLPVAAVLTSGFGTARSYNGTDYTTFHSGADLASPVGTPIYAPAPGIVVDTGRLDIRGYVTILSHGRGVYTAYFHQSAILVKPGDQVEVGQMIGKVGNTGLSTASHLHWEMWVEGVQVDAMQWVRTTFP